MTLGRIILNVSAAGLSLPKYTPRVSTFLFVHFIFKGLSERVFQGPPHKCARVPQKKDWYTIKRIKIVMHIFYCNYTLVYNNDLQYNLTLNCRTKVEGEIRIIYVGGHPYSTYAAF